MSIALRVLPSRLELKRREGSGSLAPWANVSFTAFLYVSPVQTIPSCDQTGTPTIPFDGFFHLRSSIILGSASRIRFRMRSRVSSCQSPTSADLIVFFATVHSPTGCDEPLRAFRRLAVYGNANKYRPLNRSNASGNSGE